MPGLLFSQLTRKDVAVHVSLIQILIGRPYPGLLRVSEAPPPVTSLSLP